MLGITTLNNDLYVNGSTTLNNLILGNITINGSMLYNGSYLNDLLNKSDLNLNSSEL